MTELPRKAAVRTARLAALPLGYAGRQALGFGKRLGGRSAESVLTEVQQRTAEQPAAASSRALPRTPRTRRIGPLCRVVREPGRSHY